VKAAPLFTTQRLSFSAPSGEQDLEFIFGLFEDEELMKYLGGPLSDEILVQRKEKWRKDWAEHGFGTGIFTLKETSERLGILSLFWIEKEGEKLLEIGWMTAQACQKKGFTFEAAQGYVEWVKENVKSTQAIAAHPDVENPASNKILEKLGFTPIKVVQYPYMGKTLHSMYWRFDLK
jgi:RimJ/RimL family protein N-acetyltransferase